MLITVWPAIIHFMLLVQTTEPCLRHAHGSDKTVKGTSKLVYGTNRDRVLSMLKPHIPSDSAHMRGALQCVQIVFTPIAD